MQDAVLLSALRVPYEMATESELGSRIFHRQAQAAADKIEANASRIAELEAALALAMSAPMQPVAAEKCTGPKVEAETKPDRMVTGLSPSKNHRQRVILSDQQILDIAFNGRILIRDSQIALRFARAILEAARIERLSDEKIVKIALATKTPIHTGKGALRFTRILLAESTQAQTIQI